MLLFQKGNFYLLWVACMFIGLYANLWCSILQGFFFFSFYIGKFNINIQVFPWGTAPLEVQKVNVLSTRDLIFHSDTRNLYS